MRGTPALLAFMVGLGSVGAASSQEALVACQSQQSLEQVLGSGGELMPDDCRELQVTEVQSEEEQLCAIDFSGAGEGVLQTLRDAALPEKWWVTCQDLSRAP